MNVVEAETATFGLWTALERGRRRTLVKCACGTERWVLSDTLKNGRSRGCGCTSGGPRASSGTSRPIPFTPRIAIDIPAKLARYEPELNTGCWLWTGSHSRHGYGSLSVRGKITPAHRFFYETLVGPIPAGLLLRHKCDTPACVNPAHLEPGTHRDNTMDAISRGRMTKFVHGERHRNAKLTEADVRAIRADARSSRTVARAYGISQPTLRAARDGRTWKHVV